MRHFHGRFRLTLIHGVVLVALAEGCRGTPKETFSRPPRLDEVRSWAIQLQGIEKEGAVEAIERATVDMVVLEPMRSVRGRESFPMKSVVARARGSRKLCLAYLNVGQAEDYRTYWGAQWRAPTREKRGHPGFLLSVDPDQWAGNYPVAYWDIRWRAVLFGSADAMLDRILADGFDGAYLDWVLGYAEPSVAAAARRAGVEPARAMAELIRDLRVYARKKRPGFLIVAQNGADLGHRVPEYYGYIDAVAHEDLSFRGKATDDWDDPESADSPTDEAASRALAKQLGQFRLRGLPVFTLDYCIDPRNTAAATKRSRDAGFIPCISRTPLDRIPRAGDARAR
ncbi:MAG: endo alpha-1,4 polygalactosaminidase [Planctomycetota bacterium]